MNCSTFYEHILMSAINFRLWSSAGELVPSVFHGVSSSEVCAKLIDELVCDSVATLMSLVLWCYDLRGPIRRCAETLQTRY